MKLSFKLNLGDFLSKSRGFQGIFVSPDMARAMVLSAKATVIPQAKVNVKANKSVFEGNLVRSIDARVMNVGALAIAEIATFGVYYGENIEKGTPAGSDVRASNKLARWAEVKAGAIDGKYAAKRIAKHIREHGTPAKPFLRPAWDSTKTRYYMLLIGNVRRLLKS